MAGATTILILKGEMSSVAPLGVPLLAFLARRSLWIDETNMKPPASDDPREVSSLFHLSDVSHYLLASYSLWAQPYPVFKPMKTQSGKK